jgi:hypothetical protein
MISEEISIDKRVPEFAEFPQQLLSNVVSKVDQET